MTPPSHSFQNKEKNPYFLLNKLKTPSPSFQNKLEREPIPVPLSKHPNEKEETLPHFPFKK